MDVLSLIVAIIALVIAVLAYRRVGGLADLKKQIDQIRPSVELRSSVDSLAAAADTLREKTSELVGKLEAAVRRIGKEEKPPEGRPPKRPEELRKGMPSPEDFQRELDSVFASAQREGKAAVEVKSADLHRSVGGYPGHTHRLPACCRVMRRNMKPGDEILHQPPKGAGATLVIRYALPR